MTTPLNDLELVISERRAQSIHPPRGMLTSQRNRTCLFHGMDPKASQKISGLLLSFFLSVRHRFSLT